MKRILSFMTVMFTLFVSAHLFAKESKMPQPTTNVQSEVVELVAKVKSVDSKNRRVELEGPSGDIVTVKVGDDVKNFKQIKKGDDVVVNYKESLVWSLRKKGDKEDPTKSVSSSVSTAKPGEKPAMDESTVVNIVATIKKIDKKAPSVTLQGPEGNTQTIKIKDSKNLEGVKVGDQVDITYTESLAVAVEKAPKK